GIAHSGMVQSGMVQSGMAQSGMARSGMVKYGGLVAAEAAPKCRILLVDDLDMTRSVAAEFLRADGHAVTEVPDGAAAIEAARETDFDVILTDMRMPRMDGFETTRRIRALDGQRGQVPIVLLTADLAASSAAALGNAGIDFCLNRPFRA